ncbi:hypothetical protein PMIN04_001698 [Paraphaeosphaeria minitans]
MVLKRKNNAAMSLQLLASAVSLKTPAEKVAREYAPHVQDRIDSRPNDQLADERVTTGDHIIRQAMVQG